MYSKFIAPILFGLMLTGCVAGKPIARIDFPEKEYQALAKEGTGTVTGQVFKKTVGGDTKIGAGSAVYLNPVTSYSNQWYNENYLHNKPIKEPDPRLKTYFISTVSDAIGNFKFMSVPAGDYYLVSTVTWKWEGTTTGGVVAKKISVDDNTSIKVLLTD